MQIDRIVEMRNGVGYLQAFYLLDALDGAELADEAFKAGGVVNHDGQVAAEEAVVGVDADAAQYELLVS